MEPLDYSDITEEATKLSEGLIVVAGPDRAVNARAVRAIEFALAEKVGPVYRIGAEDGDSHNRVQHVDSTGIAVPAEALDADERRGLWREWVVGFRRNVLTHEPAVITIDDIDLLFPEMTLRALRNAMLGTVVVVSVQADDVDSIVRMMNPDFNADSLTLLAAGLEMMLIHSPGAGIQLGENGFSLATIDITEEFRRKITALESV